MENTFDFKDLFVFDLANNHQGDLEHGLRIVREVAAVANGNNVKAAIKFQFRQLDTFVHPDYKDSEHPMVKRFMSTRLEVNEFQVLFDEVKKLGLYTMCTPFDEESVDIIDNMGFDLIKIASCSAKDWPLIERISRSGKPVIFSTGGLDLNDIDNLASFCNHNGVTYAMMHCVSVYPTPEELCQLNQIETLRLRYPNTTVGWSTHESPSDLDFVLMSYAKGARMFERHVGVETETIKLNGYSSTPEVLEQWILAWKKAVRSCGEVDRPQSSKEEQEALGKLKRGVFAKRNLKEGQKLSNIDVFFAFPFVSDDQVTSGEWKNGISLTAPLKEGQPLMQKDCSIPVPSNEIILKRALHEVKALLNEAKIPLNYKFKVEYSHHYGIQRFREVGAIIIGLINRSYCKKLIVQLPGQYHPAHYHKRKEETFSLLSGILHLEIDGHKRILYPGQTILVQPGVWHSFHTETGAIFEEISTTHYDDDSFYKDKMINKLERSERKSVVDHWGRFQLNEGSSDV